MWKERLEKVRIELVGVQEQLKADKLNILTLAKCLRTVVGVLLRVIDALP